MQPLVDDFRFTLAEVAVAFAGFAGLVTVLTQRLATTQREFDVVRFRDMLLLSPIAVAFALFPTLPAVFGATEEVYVPTMAGLILVVRTSLRSSSRWQGASAQRGAADLRFVGCWSCSPVAARWTLHSTDGMRSSTLSG